MKEEVPHKWVIEVTQEMTCTQACELGKVLGANGYTGHFHDGDVAGLVMDGVRWRRLKKGGES